MQLIDKDGNHFITEGDRSILHDFLRDIPLLSKQVAIVKRNIDVRVDGLKKDLDSASKLQRMLYDVSGRLSKLGSMEGGA